MKDKKMTAYFAVVTLFYMAASFAHPVTPTLIVERELDSSMFGIALASMMAASFLFSPFWGRLCGYIPTRRIILFCSVGYTVGQVIFGAAYSEWMVVAGRLFAGVFTGGCFTAFSNYVINTSTHERRDANLTALVTIQTVGSAGGYFVGGMLGLLSLKVVFAAQCALLLLCGGLFALVCLDDTPFKARPDRPLSLRDADPFRAFAEAGSIVLYKQVGACKVINGDIEKALDLGCVQVHRQNSVRTGCGDEVCDKLCGDGVAALCLAVLAGIAEVRHDGRNASGGSPSHRVDHDEQFHKVVVDMVAGGLNNEHVLAANRLINGDGAFAIREL